MEIRYLKLLQIYICMYVYQVTIIVLSYTIYYLF